MLAALAREPGPPASVVDLATVAAEPLTDGGSVRLRMLASTVNPSDLVTISGAYASRTRYPFVPGFEGVGEVVEVGARVSPGLMGKRVLPLGSAGNWQEYKEASADWCFEVPDSVATEAACFAYVNPLSALLMVDENVRADVRVAAVNGATSAIGGQLRALLAARGVEAIGLNSGATGRRVPSRSDWSAVVRTDGSGWVGEVLRLTGGAGVDVAFDCVGGEHAAALLGAVRPGGSLVHYGLLSGRPIPTESLHRHPGRELCLFRLRDFVHTASRERIQSLLDRSYEGIVSGPLRTVVTETRSLRDIGRVLGAVGVTRGKTLITFP